MYAVTAATGQLGRLTVQYLKRHVPHREIVVIVRDPGKATDLGVQVRQADYDDKATMMKALDGVDRLLLISSPDLASRALQHANVVEAAKAANIKSIIYTSVLHAEQWKLPGFDAHIQTEELIKKSGVPFTILRNGWYTENNLGALGPALKHGQLLGAAQSGRISWAARSDYAEAAAKVLAGEGHLGKTYELAGDKAHSLADFAAIAAKVSGQPLTYANMEEHQYAEVLASNGVPTPFAKLLAAVDAHAISRNILEEPLNTLSRLIGHPTTPVEESVEQFLKMPRH